MKVYSCVIILFLACVFVSGVNAQSGYNDPVAADSIAAYQDSIQHGLITDHEDEDLYSQTQKGPYRIKIIKRTYEYRRQIGFALAMMGFITLIMTSVQSWNPD